MLTVLGSAFESVLGGNFSTYDQDNDQWETNSCAEERHSGWWFHWDKEDEDWNWIPCSQANLNGLYTMTETIVGDAGRWLNRNAGMQFSSAFGSYSYLTSLKASVIKIKPF